MIAEGFTCAARVFPIDRFNDTPQSKGLERHHLGAYTFSGIGVLRQRLVSIRTCRNKPPPSGVGSLTCAYLLTMVLGPCIESRLIAER